MSEFVICVSNEGNPASLVVGKVYRRLRDEDAETHSLIRVLDEDTSEPKGYLYSAAHFESINLPAKARRAVTKTHAEV